jgi:1-pyrroline-5-carboxylate dehydrogenase
VEAGVDVALGLVGIMKLLRRRGCRRRHQLRAGSGRDVGDRRSRTADLAGVHFTGSTGVFNGMWKTIGSGIAATAYPRIVGETGGKDFVFAHASADVERARGRAAARRLRVPGAEVLGREPRLRPEVALAAVRDGSWRDARSGQDGRRRDFTNFVNAVIDKKRVHEIKGYIDAPSNRRTA